MGKFQKVRPCRLLSCLNPPTSSAVVTLPAVVIFPRVTVSSAVVPPPSAVSSQPTAKIPTKASQAEHEFMHSEEL